MEGYGLTETSPGDRGAITPAAHRIGTVGQPFPECGVPVCFRWRTGGSRGPSIFQRVLEEGEGDRAEAFTEDGWFKTGDIGNVDGDGFLSITDRKKELLKTSGGKLIAPQPIENKLKANSLVAEAALVGDKHKFACVLIAPNFTALTAWAQGNGVASTDHKVMVKDPKVVALYQGIVTQVNGTLAHFEDIKRLSLVPDEWSIEAGELTPSMKLKRRVIEKKYAAEIAEFYKDEATSSK